MSCLGTIQMVSMNLMKDEWGGMVSYLSLVHFKVTFLLMLSLCILALL